MRKFISGIVVGIMITASVAVAKNVTMNELSTFGSHIAQRLGTLIRDNRDAIIKNERSSEDAEANIKILYRRGNQQQHQIGGLQNDIRYLHELILGVGKPVKAPKEGLLGKARVIPYIPKAAGDIRATLQSMKDRREYRDIRKAEVTNRMFKGEK